jgi:hypothetical protein
MIGLLAIALLFVSLAGPAFSQRRILYVTHSAGFRHDSIRVSIQALQEIARRGGVLQITATEDLSQITAANLRQYDALFFFTSGELALSEQQRRDLLDFVRQGKGFGGAHSATDTLYTWPEYGELLGGYFDGHPWAGEVGIDIEDPDFPGMREAAPNFRIVEEIYQFRAFSRDRVRVLMTLDTSTVNLRAEGVNRSDGDFALAWCRRFGSGRVFYTALGHFDETWLDPRFQRMIEQALLWLSGEIEADATPRSTSSSAAPRIGPGSVGTVAGPAEGHAFGSVIAIYGERLTSGSTFESPVTPLPRKIAGTRVEVNGRPIPLFYASPGQVNAQLPFDLQPGATAELAVYSVNLASEKIGVRIVDVSPALFSGARLPGSAVVVYATGLGAINGTIPAGTAPPVEPLLRTTATPTVFVNNREAAVTFSGLAPALVGVYQINAQLPAGLADGPLSIQISIRGQGSNSLTIP